MEYLLSHAEIGADVASRYNVGQAVIACIAEHHNDDMSSTEAFIVSAADAISAARPGARKDTVENYIKRLEALEEVGRAFDGLPDDRLGFRLAQLSDPVQYIAPDLCLPLLRFVPCARRLFPNGYCQVN